MGLFSKLFGKRGGSPDNIAISRGPKAVHAALGEEGATFRREAGVVLGCSAEEVDLTKAIQAGYGCDELEVIEFIQIAEDVWGVSLMPSTFDGVDAGKAIKEFITLGDIVSASKAKKSI